MLKRLKSLFGGKEEPEEKTLTFLELESWLLDMLQNNNDEFNKDAKKQMEQITNHITKCEGFLDDLKNASLRNENVPPRAIQIMNGNRDSYIFSTLRFLEKIDPETYDAKEIVVVFREELKKLVAQNHKSGLVMKEFFGDESLKISNSIKDIEIQISAIEQRQKDSKTKEIQQLVDGYNEIKSKIQQQKRVAKQIKEEEAKIIHVVKKKEKIEDNITKLKQSKEYINLDELKKKKKKYLSEHNVISDRVSSHFSPIGPALKKYERISLNNQIIGQYMKDPVKALLQDEGNKISDVINDLKKQLDKLEFKDKKKDKMAEHLNNFDKEQLVAERNRLIQLDNIIAETNESIHTSGILHDFNEEEYRLKHTLDKQKILENGLNDLKKIQEKSGVIDFSQLENEINKKLNKKITIS